MVKYYGRARQRICSVNTNQIGLNMSGCPSKVGRQGYLSRYMYNRCVHSWWNMLSIYGRETADPTCRRRAAQWFYFRSVFHNLQGLVILNP